eukprot:jgi/Astpho2/4052/fgenesh1_pg.00063_%23_71_t
MQHQTVQQKINESQERVRQAVQEFQANGTSLQRKKQLSAAVQAEALLKDALRTQLEHQAAAHEVGWRLPAQHKSWTAAGSPTSSAVQSPRLPSRPGSSVDSGQLLPRSLNGHAPDLSLARSPQDSQLLQRGHWASNSVAPRTVEDRLAALQELSSPELMRRALTSTSRARQQACLSPCSPVPPSLQQQVLDTLQMVADPSRTTATSKAARYLQKRGSLLQSAASTQEGLSVLATTGWELSPRETLRRREHGAEQGKPPWQISIKTEQPFRVERPGSGTRRASNQSVPAVTGTLMAHLAHGSRRDQDYLVTSMVQAARREAAGRAVSVPRAQGSALWQSPDRRCHCIHNSAVQTERGDMLTSSPHADLSSQQLRLRMSSFDLRHLVIALQRQLQVKSQQLQQAQAELQGPAADLSPAEPHTSQLGVSQALQANVRAQQISLMFTLHHARLSASSDSS